MAMNYDYGEGMLGEEDGITTPTQLFDISNLGYLDDYEGTEEYKHFIKTILCEKSEEVNTTQLYETAEPGSLLCNATYDRALCWPTTPSGEFSVLSCPEAFNGHLLKDTGFASKYCHENGTWNEWGNYSACAFQPYYQCTVIIHYHETEDKSVRSFMSDVHSVHNAVQRLIYFTGYTVSTVALVIALVIFLYFRALKCLRNLIHCHLIVTFILKNIAWIVLHVVLPVIHDSSQYQWVCKLIVTLFCYFNLTNFFWMLVEGIYLLFMVVWAYSNDRVKIWYLIIIGWLIPFLVMVAWGVVKYLYDNDNCWLADERKFSYIHIGPVLLVLLINLFILIVIIYILVTKLRATNCAHTRQSRKAIRATLILFPLLGLTYILYVVPFSGHDMEKIIFNYINALIQSVQGLEVAVFYCFLNGEVKTVLRSRVSQWQDERSVATRYTRASVVSGMEHSPPAIRLNCQTNGGLPAGGHDQADTASVEGNGTGRTDNGYTTTKLDENTTPFISNDERNWDQDECL